MTLKTLQTKRYSSLLLKKQPDVFWAAFCYKRPSTYGEFIRIALE
jgi:hypothetical protein